MDYEFKFPNTNIAKPKKEVKEIVKEEVKFNEPEKSKNPNFVWTDKKPKKYYNIEDAIDGFTEESRERGRVKTEFISNHDQAILDIKNTKNRKANENKNR